MEHLPRTVDEFRKGVMLPYLSGPFRQNVESKDPCRCLESSPFVILVSPRSLAAILVRISMPHQFLIDHL